MNNHKYYFLFGLFVINVVAFAQKDPFYIGAFFSFLYMILVPGLLLLPFLLKKKVSPPLGVAMGTALSILLLMLTGLALNAILPFFRMATPLTTVPLLSAFDAMILILLAFGFSHKKELPFEIPRFNRFDWCIIALSALMPVLACLGAISLNNGGSNTLTMTVLGFVIILVLVVLTHRHKLDPSVPPMTLFMMALSFLLMNSMRGWFITGHDILLEYHVFTLVSNAHAWSMALYQDPYMACLSLTVFPVYLQSIMHVDGAYIFKFFVQFIGALPVIAIYYLCKEYVSDATAFLAGFLYITFPTFMTDMAFLNRQGMAFLFFSITLFVLLNTDYWSSAQRNIMLFLFATGMVLSHYSTSYIAIAVLAGAYIADRILRFIMTARWPKWYAGMAGRHANRQAYSAQKLITLPFVIGVFVIILLWSVVITKTSDTLFTTIQQIATNVTHPFILEQNGGVAKYSLLQSTPAPSETPFAQFIQNSSQQAQSSANSSALFSDSVTAQYPVVPLSEPIVPVTPLGEKLQSLLRRDLGGFFNDLKQTYAKIIQGLILLGLLGLLVGYRFRKNLLRNPPVEYAALSVSGLVILTGQTILPSSAIDYGLLRLFQQNLIFLALPIMLALTGLIALLTKSFKAQALACSIIFLLFFFVLSGMFPQMTGGGRPPLSLNNYGFYYDAYYTHAEELDAFQWFVQDGNVYTPIQSDRYFSTIKMITYIGTAPLPGLLPQTIQKNAYVYLNYDNARTGDVIEYINGGVVYYEFPLNFLTDNKNLIYNNGGSKIYR